MKSSKGITLIALIITIIVLLILAGVSLTALVGDNGIISQAIKSKEKTKEASAKEELEMAWTAQLSKYYEDISKGKISNTIESFESYFSKSDLNPLLKSGFITNITHDRTQKTFDIEYTIGNESFSIKMSDSGKVENMIIADVNTNTNFETIDKTEDRTGEPPLIEEPTLEEPVAEEPPVDGEVIEEVVDEVVAEEEIQVEIAGGGITHVCYYENEKRIAIYHTSSGGGGNVNPYGEPDYEWHYPASLIGFSFDNTLIKENLFTPDFENIKDNVEELIFISARPFQNLGNLSNLKTIDLADTELGWNNMFAGCTSLEKIYISPSFRIPSTGVSIILQNCATDHFTIKNDNGTETNVYPSQIVN